MFLFVKRSDLITDYIDLSVYGSIHVEQVGPTMIAITLKHRNYQSDAHLQVQSEYDSRCLLVILFKYLGQRGPSEMYSLEDMIAAGKKLFEQTDREGL